MYSSTELAVDLLAIVCTFLSLETPAYENISCQETPKRSCTHAYLVANG
jgi:hypothetical protein